jgi:hypothetical protein
METCRMDCQARILKELISDPAWKALHPITQQPVREIIPYKHKYLANVVRFRSSRSVPLELREEFP